MSTDIKPGQVRAGKHLAPSAPLDRTAVKAGDTVTVRVETDPKNGGTFTVAGEAYQNFGPFDDGGQMSVGGFALGEVRVTLIAHQPAPKPEWKPGTTGTATVRGVEGVKVMRTDGDGETDMLWVSAQHVGSARGHLAYQVTDFVPDEPRALPTRKQVANAVWLTSRADEGTISATGADKVADAVLDLLRGESR